MNKKLWTIIASVVLVAGLIIGLSFLPKGKPEGEGKNYNIICANSSVPPTLAAMDSILDGGDTYAYIQRGKTFSGIGELANQGFTNAGFLTNSQANEISPQAVTKMVDNVKRIKANDKNATFNIYVTDFDAYAGFAIGIYAGLKDEDYKVVMIEDGSSTYANFYNYFISGKTYTEENDQPFETFSTLLNSAKTQIAAMKSDVGNPLTGENLKMGNPYVVYALATLNNAEYRVQDISKITNELTTSSVANSRLTKIYKGEDNEYKVHVKSSSISTTMSKFNAEQKDKYLKLVFGAANKDATINLLTRTVDANNKQVSSKKLVYIGTRVYGYNYELVDDLTEENYSTYIVDYSTLQALADTDEFAAFLTTEYNEEDWNSLKALMPTTYSAAYTAAFNTFQEYRYSFSYVLKEYCGVEEGKYDLLYKGHPSELVDNISTFKEEHYQGNGFSFKKEIYTLVNHFHFNDSLGKRIGVMPGGVAAENFAYLGLDFAICGLDSSTYTGYEPSVPVEFVIGGGAYNVFSNNLKGRYDAGTLKDSKGDNTLILSKGNILKMLGRTEEYNTWLKSTFGIAEANIGNYDLARTGLLEYSASHTSVDKTIKRNVSFGHYVGDTYVVDTTKVNVANGTFLSDIVPEFTGTVPEGYKFAGWAFVGQTSTWNSYFNTIEGDLQMFAVFSKVVELNSNYPTDKEDVKTNLTVYYNWDTKITDVTSLKYAVDGYTFAGWATTNDATTAEFTNASQLPKANDVTTLYAVWTPNTTK